MHSVMLNPIAWLQAFGLMLAMCAGIYAMARLTNFEEQ